MDGYLYIVFHNSLPSLGINHWGIPLDQMLRTVIGRISIKYLLERMALDIGTKTLGTLLKLQILLAAASVSQILDLAHLDLMV
ncbi:hypothetical protein N7478_003309 [Penicillium angulare]|uniref:uncharacterized protein n=1 Tax=Penicillium angulare TaxID=116970 RepID=UPI00253F9700|nr:uncharacterized protein N7478_003309 [Penicillium angulare]KAJ5287623.1 hypothetical protein N7478_003309 [Penicillium angulare]